MIKKTISTTLIMCILIVFSSCNNNRNMPPEIIKSDKMVDIGTHKLRVVLTDIPSKYTIVLEAGGGMTSDVYKDIQDTIVKSTGVRTISYDRSGYGQSELGPDNFNAIDEVDALKNCLRTIGINKNLILVGHSYGGLLAQLYTARYPKMVSGLILIDPMNINFVDKFGIDNLNAATPYYENPTEKWQIAGNRMVDNFSIALEELRGKVIPKKIPAILITSGIPPVPEIWRECHEQMVRDSDRHKMIIAEDNNHDIVTENPKLVAQTVVELVNKL